MVINMQGTAENILKTLEESNLRHPQPAPMLAVTDEQMQEVKDNFRNAPQPPIEYGHDESIVLEIGNYARGILDVFAQRWPMQLTRFQILDTVGQEAAAAVPLSGAMSELQTKGLIAKDG